MPGHIFLQTGDYELATKTNVNAAAADKAFVERTGATGVYPLMYYTHNLPSVPTRGRGKAGTKRRCRVGMKTRSAVATP
jgi:hypothetical protein